MKPNQPLIFLRNDDVRHQLDDSLIRLTELCIRHCAPIAHAVEPANVGTEVVSWLLEMKQKFPDIIEIIQHGYNHNLGNPQAKMEFGGNRSFSDQLADLQKGKDLMNAYFGNQWLQVFTFPYGTYNPAALKAIDQLGYAGLSSKINYNLKSRIKNTAGRLLGLDMLLGKKVNYHPLIRKGYHFREISVSANLIKKYTGDSTAEHFSVSDVIQQIHVASKHTSIIGLLFHHRFHGEYLEQTEQILATLAGSGYRFSTLSAIL